jgi:putative oxidoreductase
LYTALKKIFGGPERWERLGGAMGNLGIDFYPVIWGFMASFAEFVGGLFLVLGLLFRPATLLIFITMIVASVRHFSDGDPIGRIAYPLEMSFVMILLFLLGPGKHSLDELISKKMRRKN